MSHLFFVLVAALAQSCMPHLLDNYTAYDLETHILGLTTHERSKQNFWIPPRRREQTGSLLEAIGGFKVGVELGGVHLGGFAQLMLESWPSCER